MSKKIKLSLIRQYFHMLSYFQNRSSFFGLGFIHLSFNLFKRNQMFCHKFRRNKSFLTTLDIFVRRIRIFFLSFCFYTKSCKSFHKMYMQYPWWEPNRNVNNILSSMLTWFSAPLNAFVLLIGTGVFFVIITSNLSTSFSTI